MTKPLEPRDLWIDDHLSDAALSALADGQLGIVPEDACTHAETCAACADRLAAIATLATEIHVAITPITAERAKRASRFPVGLVIAALALAALGAAPSLSDRASHALSLATSLPHLVPQIASAASSVALSLSHGPLGAMVTFAVFAVLALSGALVSRSSRAHRGALS